MATKGSEKKLQKDLQYSLGCAFPGNHYIRVTHPDVYEEAGKPDLIGHIFGMHVEIELKVDNNRLSTSQKEQIRRVNDSGGFACVMVHHRKDDAYYLVTDGHIESFSYRNRKENWTWLPHSRRMVGDQFRTVINLNPMHILIAEKLKERYT